MPRSPLAEALSYLADIGWEEVRRGASPARPEASSDAAPVVPPGRVAEAAAGEPGDREESLRRLAAEAAECRSCRLCETRQRVVFGSGRAGARLMFVGEGPGAEEDRQGLPFVGRAGELLTRIIGAIELRREDCYIANIVKCRPPGNRDPQPDEAAACRRYLDGQIDAIRPAVLVALGRVAAQALLGTEAPLGRMRGQWYEVRGVPTLVTYHPAALLRNPELKRPTWEDMQRVRDRLRESG
ncbi:MAG TPA: uracil-DNA glycosylase [Thermoanaerobaculia bacterium]|nr:uracil-DNA glycosylase [Thermoanaerobaculia bacterium]